MIELYVPPAETTVSRRIVEPERAVFPRVTKEGLPVEEAEPEAGEEEILLPPPKEIAEVDREAVQAMLDEADQVLKGANREAEEILKGARRAAEAEFEKARETGYRAGYQTGYEEARKKAQGECRMEYEQRLQVFEENMNRALRSVEEAKERCLRNYLDELKECAIAIAEKVIQISLRSSGEVIRQMIISATEKLKKTAWVKIYIDKGDYDMMMEADADVIDELSHLSDNIKFIVMNKEDNGNCIIEMPEEIVDVSVNTQMENIKDILENVRV